MAGVKALCVPAGLIASLIGVFYCFGVFDVQTPTLLPQVSMRSQGAPTTQVAVPPRGTPAEPKQQAEKKAPVATEPAAGKSHAYSHASLPPPAPPRVELPRPGLSSEPPLQERVDELLEQVLAVDARAQVQAQVQAAALEPPGTADFDPNVPATPSLELPQHYEATTLQDDLPQQ